MQMLQDAKQVKPSNYTEDIYSAKHQLEYYSINGGESKVTAKLSDLPEDQKNIENNLMKFNKNFNPSVFENSFAIPEISEIFKAFNWDFQADVISWHKALVDKYDFDGDGRLNPNEFIFMAIRQNRKVLGEDGRKHVFKEIIENKIDAIFSFIDCDNDGFISSENLWEGLKLLKRNNKGRYDMYKCVFPNGDLRTASPNDVVLKSMKVADGFLNRVEFRQAILLGYWNRQTDKNGVIENDSINLKNLRWTNDGAEDIVCNKIMKFKKKE